MDKDLKHIVENEQLNLSKFLNDTLETFFSVASVEDIDNEISSIRDKCAVLEKKRADLVSQGVAVTKGEEISKQALEELKDSYNARREHQMHVDKDGDWISAPKNLKRLRILGWTVEYGLKELRDWYDGEKGRKDKKA